MKKKNPAKKKTKAVKVVAKKAKSAAKKKTTSAAVKKVKSVVKKKKATSVVKAKTKKPVKAKAKSPVKKTVLFEVTATPGADLHFMPEQGQTSPVTPFEARQAENIFHHKEEVALHQENEKVKEAMSSRKSVKSSYHRGRGPR